jgi:hypothetical protein
MRYMVLVKSDGKSEAGVLPTEKELSEMGKFNDELIKAGLMLAGEGLQASSKGVRVKYSNGEFKVTDGPFTEAKELVAGFWVLQAKSKQEVLDWVKRAPFREGEVEVRPLFDLEDFPVDPSEKSGGWREKEEQARNQPPPRRAGTTRYIGLLKADATTEAGVMPDPTLLEAMGAFMEEATRAGVLLSGEGLKPSKEGFRVRYAGDQRTVIDGPFAESKELIAGYAILQYKTKEEAIEWTKRFLQVDVPTRQASEGECELREIFELEDFPVNPDEKPGGWRDVEQRFRDTHS